MAFWSHCEIHSNTHLLAGRYISNTVELSDLKKITLTYIWIGSVQLACIVLLQNIIDLTLREGTSDCWIFLDQTVPG